MCVNVEGPPSWRLMPDWCNGGLGHADEECIAGRQPRQAIGGDDMADSASCAGHLRQLHMIADAPITWLQGKEGMQHRKQGMGCCFHFESLSTFIWGIQVACQHVDPWVRSLHYCSEVHEEGRRRKRQ